MFPTERKLRVYEDIQDNQGIHKTPHNPMDEFAVYYTEIRLREERLQMSSWLGNSLTDMDRMQVFYSKIVYKHTNLRGT